MNKKWNLKLGNIFVYDQSQRLRNNSEKQFFHLVLNKMFDVDVSKNDEL